MEPVASDKSATRRDEPEMDHRISTRATRGAHDERRRSPLTPRELDVVGLVARGSNNRQIARELALSERTVEWHLGNVLHKLAVRSRLEVAVWALQQDAGGGAGARRRRARTVDGRYPRRAGREDSHADRGR